MISTFIELNPLQLTFYSAALLAIVASVKVITGKNTVHALLYLVVSLLAVAVCFYLMGAPFAAGLEVISSETNMELLYNKKNLLNPWFKVKKI